MKSKIVSYISFNSGVAQWLIKAQCFESCGIYPRGLECCPKINYELETRNVAELGS